MLKDHEHIRAAGVVKWYSTSKNYGFVVPDGGGPDVFVHCSKLMQPHTRLHDGDRVTYEIEPAPDNSGRLRARHVKVEG